MENKKSRNLIAAAIAITAAAVIVLLVAGFAAAGFVLSMFLRVQNTKRVFS